MDTAANPSPTPAPLFASRRKRSRKPLLFLVCLAGLGILGWQLYPRFSSTESAPTYTTETAQRTRVASQVTATGTLSPVVQIEVGSQISGRIAALHVDYNARVKAGDVIAEIDPLLFQSAVAQAKARLSSSRAGATKAKATVTEASAHYKRMKALSASGAVATAEVESAYAAKRNADASLSAAYADITLAKAALEQAEVNLTYTTIKAPVDGMVISRNVELGQTVAASLSAPVLFVIAGDMSQMEVHTSVAESDVGKVTDGVRVEFTVDAFPGQTFQGVVKQVRYQAETVSNVVTYDAVVSADNASLQLRPGMTANVTFITAERKDVLAVPNKALRFRPANMPVRTAAKGSQRARGEGRARDPNRKRPSMVWVLRDGELARVRVETGLADESHTEVVGGELHEGDLIVTSDGASGTAQRTQRPNGQQRRGRRGPPAVL